MFQLLLLLQGVLFMSGPFWAPLVGFVRQRPSYYDAHLAYGPPPVGGHKSV